MSLVKGRLGPLRFPLLASPTNLQTCYFDLDGGEAPAEELDALADRMLATGAAQVRLDWLSEGARLLDAAATWARRHPIVVEPFAISPLASCSGDFESYLARTGSSVRKYWKACRRHVLSGPIEFEIVTGGPGLAKLVDEMFALEASGWKGREGSAILSLPADAHFYRSLAFAAAEAGALRIATLREEGRLLAYEYSLVGGDTILAMKVGYDESRSRLQPGHMIALLNIRDACEDPAIAWYDMLGNSMRIAEYKRRFATDYRTICRIRLFSRTGTGRLLYALYRSKPLMKALRGRVRGLAGRLRR
jgi:CelD/BcsL family acetyltransferase involved in cellulose biosynthesis